MVRTWLRLAAAIALAASASAYADDGAIEINQVCATGSGCLGGDSPGFPVSISGAQRYVLTSSLEVPSATVAIEVSGDGATLDLNGFEIAGPVTCTGQPVTSCDSSSFEPMISALGSNNFSIMNGRVSGSAGNAIESGRGSYIRNIRVEHSGTGGIRVNSESEIHSVRSSRNGSVGILVGSESLVSDVIARGNGLDGLRVERNVVIDGATLVRNGGHGVNAFRGSVVKNVSSMFNEDTGVSLIDEFGQIPYEGSATILDSTIAFNAGVGIECPISGTDVVTIGRVLLNENNQSSSSQWSGNCLGVGQNSCNGNLSCPN